MDAAPVRDDPWDALIAQNTAPDPPQGRTRGVALSLATIQAERFYGSGWYHNPVRWPTQDGIVPWPVFWMYWAAIPSIQAGERIERVQAANLGSASGEEARRIGRAWQRVAEGGDVDGAR